MKHRARSKAAIAAAVVFGILTIAGLSGSAADTQKSVINTTPTSTTKAVEATPVPPPEPVLSCTVEAIPFEKQTQNDPDLEAGKTEIRQSGANGQQEVCTTDGIETSRKVLTAATTEITAKGTKVTPPAPAPQPAYVPTTRVGAICADGWRSSATGRGACSHHGGVDHWLYE